MPKSIEFEHKKVSQYPYDRVKITMTSWAWDLPSSKQTKQFTVGLQDLKAALKAAGLYETVEVPADSKIQAEIAMYQALCTIEGSSGTVTLNTSGKEARDKLWRRIQKSLDL